MSSETWITWGVPGVALGIAALAGLGAWFMSWRFDRKWGHLDPTRPDRR